MKVRTLLLTLAVPAVIALTAGAQPATAQPAAGQPEPVIIDWPTQDKLLGWAAAVEHEGQQHHPEVYAGVAIDPILGTVVVHRVPSAAFDDAVRRLLPPSAAVRYVDAVYPERELAAWAAEVVADIDYWRERGVELNLVGSRPGQCVLVGTEDPVRDAASIGARYPGWPLCVEHDGGAVTLVGEQG
ncbi:hypothetical protein CA850_28245 [Micromonospora echinospora]|uniref:Uncharacterized protein n=1 Tax=Micromonospora echinospora TaxID=1877 RepID=A0A1C4ZWL4_MICEC|nr:hypothetical protein [Micromonospora echinospora]OZV75729.1 hypothetical protein CA850_28245 [Micromonospora echinospora]SCF37362.1 hypothetical protein GA0070618_5899 [Micromonospora echinospora]